MSSHPNFDTVIFLGPTLALEEATNLFNAHYLPPAQMGDVYKLLNSNVQRIVIIDGLFGGSASIWHRELLAALDCGIEVHGCSSMGALRASELEAEGMIGHGIVYEWILDSVVTGDDEVAVLHELNFPYRSLTIPLVNIRYGLLSAVKDDILSPAESNYLFVIAKSINYQLRTLEVWLNHSDVKLNSNTIEDFRLYWIEFAPNIKADDARQMLALLADKVPILSTLPVKLKAGKIKPINMWENFSMTFRTNILPDLESVDNIQNYSTNNKSKFFSKTKLASIVAAQLWLLELFIDSYNLKVKMPIKWAETYRESWISSLGLVNNIGVNQFPSSLMNICDIEYEISRRAQIHWFLSSQCNGNNFFSCSPIKIDKITFQSVPIPLQWCIWPLVLEPHCILNRYSIQTLTFGCIQQLMYDYGLDSYFLYEETCLSAVQIMESLPELPIRLGYLHWNEFSESCRVMQINNLCII